MGNAMPRTGAFHFARNHIFVTIFGVALPLLLFAGFIGYPICYTIYLSFFKWNGMAPIKRFIGLDNYAYLIHSQEFYLAVLNNFKWMVVSLCFPVVFGFLIAYGLRSRLVYFTGLVRSAVFFPVTMSLVAAGLMFLLILNPAFGALNTLLRAIGLGFLVREWFGDYHIAIYTLAVIFGWAFTGLPMIFYYAGIGDIPKETLDAARIEGAGHLKIIRSVALPQLRPVTAVVVLLTIFESLKAFDLVVVLTKGAPFGSTNVLGYLIYNESFWNSRFGYGACLSVAVLVLSIIAAAAVLRKALQGAFDA
jgi:multiple sugar transport system permease protein/raffinose/stachyose/melibiose transport system permease protein